MTYVWAPQLASEPPVGELEDVEIHVVRFKELGLCLDLLIYRHVVEHIFLTARYSLSPLTDNPYKARFTSKSRIPTGPGGRALKPPEALLKDQESPTALLSPSILDPRRSDY